MASIRIAVASPTPNCLNISIESVAKTAKTPTMTIAALVTTPAVELMPVRDRLVGGRAPLDGLTDPAEQEHVVVHREPEQDHKQKQRDDRVDPARRREAEEAAAEAVLEDEHQHAVGGARPRAG